MDEASELLTGFKGALAHAILVPVESSVNAIAAALRKYEAKCQMMGPDALRDYANEQGKLHNVLQRVAPEPAVMAQKCVRVRVQAAAAARARDNRLRSGCAASLAC